MKNEEIRYHLENGDLLQAIEAMEGLSKALLMIEFKMVERLSNSESTDPSVLLKSARALVREIAEQSGCYEQKEI